MDQGFLEPGKYAKVRGLTAGRVSQLKAKNLLVTTEHPSNPRSYLVDVAATEKRIVAASNPAKLKKPPAQKFSTVTLTEAADIALERQKIERDTKALDLAERLSMLTDLQEVEARRAQEGRLVRERVTATLRQLAERLAVMTDPRAITTLLQAAMDTTFTGLADELEAAARANASDWEEQAAEEDMKSLLESEAA